MKFTEKHTKHEAAGNNHNGIHRRQPQIEYSIYTMLSENNKHLYNAIGQSENNKPHHPTIYILISTVGI